MAKSMTWSRRTGPRSIFPATNAFTRLGKRLS